MSQGELPPPILDYTRRTKVQGQPPPAPVDPNQLDPMARLILLHSKAMADFTAQFAWMSERLSAVEARLGIQTPPPPAARDTRESKALSALEQMSNRIERIEEASKEQNQ